MIGGRIEGLEKALQKMTDDYKKLGVKHASLLKKYKAKALGLATELEKLRPLISKLSAQTAFDDESKSLQQQEYEQISMGEDALTILDALLEKLNGVLDET